MTPKEKYNNTVSKTIIDNLNKRNMEAYYCETADDALKKALELIPEGSSVSWGGSQSINQIGLTDAIKNGNYIVYDRANAKTPEETKEIYRKAYFCDYYLGSSNAITLDGKLVNIDGTGNRLSAYIYGPEHIILIVGINKISENEKTALSRVRNHASVINVMRFDNNTPCLETGKCHDCYSQNTICCQILTTRFSKIKNRIKVILVGEQLGY